MTLGVILAGGKSSRMGIDKASLTIGSETFIERIKASMNKCELIDDIVISSSNSSHAQYGKIIEDKIVEIGPIGGIYSVSQKVSANKYLFIACDTPFVTTQSMTTLIENSNAIAYSTNRLHPTVACYDNSAINKLNERINSKNYALMKWVSTFAYSTIELPINELQNFNTQADYNKIK